MGRRPTRFGETREDMIRTLLVDGNGLFKVGFHGAKNMFNRDGDHIGGLYQFLVTLRKLIKERSYHNIIIFWDGKLSGKMRFELYSEYKESRNKNYVTGNVPDNEMNYLDQKFKTEEYLEDLAIKQYRHDIVEADDLIAHYCNNKKNNERIVICTNDEDICQLIEENVVVYHCNKKRYFDTNGFRKEFGYPPENIKVVKILTGDVSDCIKGVKGVGKKTLLKFFPDIKTAILTLEDVRAKAKILQNNRIEAKQKPLKSLDNIINGVTDGSQGDKLYEINEKIIDLRRPLITEDCKNEVDIIIDGDIDFEGRSLEHIYNKMVRDGLDNNISDNYLVEFLMPFKEYNNRYKKITN